MIAEKINKITAMKDCPIRTVLDRVGDKWSILIIDMLGNYGTLRFNELNRNIEGISQRMLTVTLKTLETDGLVSRKLYPQIPPKVEYKLTELGESMLPAIVMLKSWAEQNMPDILKARAEAQNKSR